ncbi:uncharacterized protein MELLADRAFT_104868 [Melampsora larici-populina 98AG31]|uniref:CxC1-like cysteine cluster associated with KDZ transposases domain-containing protein n=1 Tax=Melampsora larici-populina (strain 98AG31 / pathotype 3-4-7) TaxID=747676 RepID=F4RG09_MELLP|nr:uncharacterized protein MELLADRAFT_104868 [Melampsora larici-populina 98AG31]EGG08671.1 hypothetical protein MELLADRAFT_104868 [Melampsora larici-populina 98AG31]
MPEFRANVNVTVFAKGGTRPFICTDGFGQFLNGLTGRLHSQLPFRTWNVIPSSIRYLTSKALALAIQLINDQGCPTWAHGPNLNNRNDQSICLFTGLNDKKGKQLKAVTPAQRQFIKNQQRDLRHAEQSNAAFLQRLKGGVQPATIAEPNDAARFEDGPEEPEDVPDNFDMNHFMPGNRPPELQDLRHDPVMIALKRQRHQADRLAHEHRWLWQYAIMLPTFLRLRFETSNWFNNEKCLQDFRPPCNCAKRTEREVDLLDLISRRRVIISFCKDCDLSDPVRLLQMGYIAASPHTKKYLAELQESEGSLSKLVAANATHTTDYFQAQWVRQRELQLKAINVQAKEKRARVKVLVKLEEELLEARKQLEDMNAANAAIRTAEHRHDLLDLPRSLVNLEAKVQEVADELGNTELLNVRHRSNDRVKSAVTVQVALAMLYKAKFDEIQQQANAAAKTGEARVIEWRSIHSGLNKRSCRLWKWWDRGLLDVISWTSPFVENSAAIDGNLITRWREMVDRTSWGQIMGVPIFWAHEDDVPEEPPEEPDEDLFMYYDYM